MCATSASTFCEHVLRGFGLERRSQPAEQALFAWGSWEIFHLKPRRFDKLGGPQPTRRRHQRQEGVHAARRNEFLQAMGADVDDMEPPPNEPGVSWAALMSAKGKGKSKSSASSSGSAATSNFAYADATYT